MASVGEKALKVALKKREFDPVYYFHGDDDFLKVQSIRELMDVAVDAATRDFNLEQRRGADLDAEALDSLLGTPPMLATRRVVILRDVDKLKKDARRFLDAYLVRPATDTLLVLVSAAGVRADKGLSDRSVGVEFAPLNADRVLKWVSYHAETVLHRTISPAAVSLLVAAAGDDLAQLAVELEKLASYSSHEIDEAAVSAVVGVRRGESVADLLDAIAERDAPRAIRLVPVVLQQPKTTAVSIVMNLTIQVLAMAYADAALAHGTPSRALFTELMVLLKETGAFPGRPWGEAVTAWTGACDRWTARDLDRALAALLQTDEALKESRLSSEQQLLASLVLALCAGGSSQRVA